ncbi:MAG: hypothetical protein WD379_04145 [Dehalococcoidia bacterium]
MTQPPTSELDARIEMKAFIDRSRAPYAEWYVGLSADPQTRLHEEHGVQESDWFIHRRLAGAEAAQRVHASLVALGCEAGGAAEGEEDEPTGVYAYWKRGHTTP